MRMGQGVRTGLGHGGITCVLQTQFSSFTVQWLSRLSAGLLIQRSRVRATLAAEHFPTVNRVQLQTAFHYHISIVLI